MTTIFAISPELTLAYARRTMDERAGRTGRGSSPRSGRLGRRARRYATR